MHKALFSWQTQSFYTGEKEKAWDPFLNYWSMSVSFVLFILFTMNCLKKLPPCASAGFKFWHRTDNGVS